MINTLNDYIRRKITLTNSIKSGSQFHDGYALFIFFCLFIVVSTVNSSYAQDVEIGDAIEVVMTSGKKSDAIQYIYKGIVVGVDDRFIEIDMTNRTAILNKKNIVSISFITLEPIQKPSTEVEEDESTKTSNPKKMKGYFISIGPQLSFGDGFVAPGISLSAGKKFNEFFAFGLSCGYNQWDFDFWPSGLTHVSFEARGWITKNPVSPYYRLNLGKGFDLSSDESRDFENIKGGTFYRLACGIRLLGSSPVQINLEVGYNGQKATYANSAWGVIERKVFYHRGYFGASMMF